jgi:hypothetical protein
MNISGGAIAGDIRATEKATLTLSGSPVINTTITLADGTQKTAVAGLGFQLPSRLYINVSQLIEMLDVDLVQDYDGLYIATKAVGSDTYMIRFEINNIEDDISPDTHIAIFQGQQE